MNIFTNSHHDFFAAKSFNTFWKSFGNIAKLFDLKCIWIVVGIYGGCLCKRKWYKYVIKWYKKIQRECVSDTVYAKLIVNQFSRSNVTPEWPHTFRANWTTNIAEWFPIRWGRDQWCTPGRAPFEMHAYDLDPGYLKTPVFKI